MTCDLCQSNPATDGFLCASCVGLEITDPFDALVVEPLTVEQLVDIDIRARRMTKPMRAFTVDGAKTGVWHVLGYSSWQEWSMSLNRPNSFAPDGVQRGEVER